MNSVKTVLIALVLMCLAPVVAADEADDKAAIRGALGGINVSSIEPTPVPGLYEVVIGGNVVYFSGDGRYMMQGELVDFKAQESLTAVRRTSIRQGILGSLDEKKMIIFKPEKVKHTITVFTDIDCSYCRTMHDQIDQYLEKGIEVRYMFFPRSGPKTPSYYKAVSVWCAEDSKQALTDSKSGRQVPNKTCENPIDEHMQLAKQMGLRGTPYILFENGQSPPGYMAPDQMAMTLKQLEAGSK